MADTTSEHLVTVHALDAGHLTLPERFFVSPLEDVEARTTVPSLSFLIQHVDSVSNTTTRIVFDLGIRKQLDAYSPLLYKHALTRQPISGTPDTVQSLALGGLNPDDIDIVMFSHLHWDHVGTPSDYPDSVYVIGPGAKGLITGASTKNAVGNHNHFEPDLLDLNRTIELPVTSDQASTSLSAESTSTNSRLHQLFERPWMQKGHFDSVMDIFGDGSVHVVSAPGHLDGHINLLCRVSPGKHIYLAGDACHDKRLLTGDKTIATWTDDNFPGVTCCIHKDKAQAERTLDSIRNTLQNPGELGTVEVVFAHDVEWANNARKENKFFPGNL